MLCSECGLSAVDWADEINAPFRHPAKLMDTNDIPSAADQAAFRNVLSQAASDLSRLDMEIERQKAVLDRLVQNVLLSKSWLTSMVCIPTATFSHRAAIRDFLLSFLIPPHSGQRITVSTRPNM